MKVKILSLTFLLLATSFLTSCIKSQTEGVQVLDVTTFERKMNQPEIQLVDVRTPQEYNDGHIENAVNINFMSDDFDASVADLDKEKPVMVYCKSGGRSAKAAARLKELGFKTITDLDGGISSWNGENKPTVK